MPAKGHLRKPGKGPAFGPPGPPTDLRSELLRAKKSTECSGTASRPMRRITKSMEGGRM